LFLDEPTAGVDVELRREMWNLVGALRDTGVTIILTTHYIEEAEHMADRIGVINRGRIVLVEDKATLMKKLGKKQLAVTLAQPLASLPESLSRFALELSADGNQLVYTFDATVDHCIPDLLRALGECSIDYKDLRTRESSLEEIFVSLVEARS
jgi:ABC-2 type transport system ATP-binding protein